MRRRPPNLFEDVFFIDIRHENFFMNAFIFSAISVAAASSISVKAAEIGEPTIGTGSRSLLLHVVMLVNDARLVLTNFRLLSLIEHRVEVLIQIILRLIEVRRRGRHLSGWYIEAILRLPEGEIRLGGYVRLCQFFARNLSELVGARAGKLFRATECLLIRHQFRAHGLLVTGITKFLHVFIATGARQAVITTLLDIIDEHFLHSVATNTERVLLIGLTTIGTECIAELITCGAGQLARLVGRCIVVETSGGMVERSANTTIARFIEFRLSIVGHVLVEVLALREAGRLGERVQLLRRRVVDGRQVGHVDALYGVFFLQK